MPASAATSARLYSCDIRLKAGDPGWVGNAVDSHILLLWRGSRGSWMFGIGLDVGRERGTIL